MTYNLLMTMAIALIAFAIMSGPGGFGILLAGASLVCQFMANQIAITQIPASQQTITVKAEVIE